MAFSDPYEEWKAQGRPGGTYKPPAPMPALPARAQPLTTPPAPRPPAPAPAPAPAPQTNYLDGVGGSDAAVNEANQAYNAGQRGSDPTKIFRPGQLEQMRAGAAGSSEDYARFSNETMAGWEQYRQPGTMKYRSMRGAPGLFDKPTECPPGQGPSGPNETDPCTTVGYSTPGPGGGGGQGGPGSGGVGGGGGFGGGDMASLEAWWKSKIDNTGSRYSPEAMAALEADAFSRARAQEKNQLAFARQDQAQRGVSRSANQNAAVRQIGVGTGQAIMANRAEILRKKIDADYQDKQQAINNAMAYVNSMRDFLLRSDSNAIQREQIGAQIRLAMQNIQAQKDMLEQNYQNNLAMNFATGG